MAAKLRITLKITRKNPGLDRQLANATTAGLNRAADFLVGELRKVVSTPNPFRRPRGTYINRANADAGEPPYLRTGEGMQSIRRTATGRISMLRRMALLEFGTRRIQPRPWYHVTIKRLAREITRRVFQ